MRGFPEPDLRKLEEGEKREEIPSSSFFRPQKRASAAEIFEAEPFIR
jgi:hypothetical protein